VLYLRKKGIEQQQLAEDAIMLSRGEFNHFSLNLSDMTAEQCLSVGDSFYIDENYEVVVVAVGAVSSRTSSLTLPKFDESLFKQKN